MKIPASNIDHMLIDPGKFFVSLTVSLTNQMLPQSLITTIVYTIMKDLMEAACPDDKPKSEKEFFQELDDYTSQIIKDMNEKNNRDNQS